MTLAEGLTLGGVCLAVIGALIGVVWSLLLGKIDDLQKSVLSLVDDLQKSHDKLDQQHDSSHERVIQVEERAETNKEKIKEVDDRRHRYQVENTHNLHDLQKWITEKVIEALSKP